MTAQVETETSIMSGALIQFMSPRNASICILTMFSGMTLKGVGTLFGISAGRVRDVRLKGERILKRKAILDARKATCRRYLT